MRQGKPDLLIILTTILFLAMMLTSFGGTLLSKLDVQAYPSLKYPTRTQELQK